MTNMTMTEFFEVLKSNGVTSVTLNFKDSATVKSIGVENNTSVTVEKETKPADVTLINKVPRRGQKAWNDLQAYIAIHHTWGTTEMIAEASGLCTAAVSAFCKRYSVPSKKFGSFRIYDIVVFGQYREMLETDYLKKDGRTGTVYITTDRIKKYLAHRAEELRNK